jgi:hypothetical protein
MTAEPRTTLAKQRQAGTPSRVHGTAAGTGCGTDPTDRGGQEPGMALTQKPPTTHGRTQVQDVSQ